MTRCLYLLQLPRAAGIDTSSELEMGKQDLCQLLDTFSPERDKGQVRQKSAVIAGAEWCTDTGIYQYRQELPDVQNRCPWTTAPLPHSSIHLSSGL